MSSRFHRPALLAVSIACCALTSAHALGISKNSGATTPNLSDFTPAAVNHPRKAGYNETQPDKMFLETFRTACPQGQKVSAATFSIQLKKLQSLAINDSMGFVDNQVGTFAVRLWGNEPVGTTKTLTYNLAALPPVGGSILANTGAGLGILADGDFSFTVQDDTAVMQASLEYQCAGGPKKGLTFGQYPKHATSGVATAACQGQPGGNCEAYNGDQVCTVALPMLCTRQLGLPNPVSNTQDPQHWSGAVMATTADVSPAAANLTTKAQADAYCVAQFGAGWTVGDFHAGGGWKFGAYGNVGQSGKRAWVNIKDQANANCWTQ